MTAEVKPGYKPTEVGVIPEDWEVRQLSEHFNIYAGGDVPKYSLSQNQSELHPYPIFANALKSEGLYGYTNECRSKANSLTITARGFLGHAEYRNQPFFPIVRLLVLEPTGELDARFTTYMVNSQIKFPIESTGVPQLTAPQVGKYSVASPPTVFEQQVIAQTLSDMDAVINSLDQLIAKKRDIQQATMQQLLTGQRRLPGFSGEWKNGELRDVVRSLEAGVSVNSTDDLPEPDLPCILKTSALSGGNFLPHESKAIVAADRTRACTNPKRNTILISRMNTPSLVGEIAYVEKDYDWLFLPDRLWMTQLMSDDCVNVRWLAYLLSSRPYRKLLQDSATGTSGSMKNISKDVLLNLQISYPAIEEQSAIATFLSDMGAELAAIEDRRDKNNQLKQGMMQELLTGRVRLA